MSKIIDVHTQIGYGEEVPFHVEDTLRLMDANAIDMAVISPILSYPRPLGIASSTEQNDNIAECLARFPDRFAAGLGAVDPRNGASAVGEVRRIMGELKLAGLVFDNDYTGLAIDHPTMYKFIQAASEYDGAVVMVNTVQYSVLKAPFMLGKLARAFPNVTFINACALMTMTQVKGSKDLSHNHPNIYIDMSRCNTILDALGGTIDEVGDERVLFGSYSPFYSVCQEKILLNRAAVPQESKEKIFYRNASNLFNLKKTN
ncbi:MAG: amidohydrolase family protein [Oscillospiraceae bacterium]|jgi:predicted TIM-barrel fold metal-dependent hydrolase|nr:amidohydrolase family protein [Oscillospiraceae bacterium]